MSPLWFLPLIVIAVGLGGLAIASVRAARESASVRHAAADLRTLCTDITALRVDAAAVCEGAMRLRAPDLRPVAGSDARAVTDADRQ